MDQRRDDFDPAILRTQLYDLIKGFVISGTAIGISRTVLLHGSDIYLTAPSTSAQLTATERKWALRNGT